MVRALLAGTKTQTRRVVKPSPDVEGHYKQWTPERRDHWVRMNPYGQPGDRLWVRETWVEGGASSSSGGGEEDRYNLHVEYPADGERRTIAVTKKQSDAWLDKAIERQRKYCPAEPQDQEAADYWDRFYAREEWITKQYKIHRPSIFMPRWASRLTLEVVAVRVERVQAISGADALAEGVTLARDESGAVIHQLTGKVKASDYWPCKTWAEMCDLPDCEAQLLRAEYAALWDSINGPGSWAANPYVWVVEFKRVEGRAV